jgi:hypothetical protein
MGSNDMAAKLGVVSRVENKAEVGFVVYDLSQRLIHGTHRNRQFNLGVTAGKSGQWAGEGIEKNFPNHHGKFPAVKPLQTLKRGHQLRVMVLMFTEEFQNHATRFGGFHSSIVPLDQDRSQFMFQLRNLTTDRRGREVEAVRRCPHGA